MAQHKRGMAQPTALAAIRDGQHSMTDIAVAVELSVSRVSRIAKRLEAVAKSKA